MARERLSIILITKNEEAKIARCLESVRFADEVIVVDGESTDRTAAIAASMGARVINHRWEGSFAKERVTGVSASTGDWVLQMDADETISDELRATLQRLMIEGTPHAAFRVRRLNEFLGRRMRHGGWYHYNTVLLRKSRCRYDMSLVCHERHIVDGTIGVIEAPLEHRPFANLTQFVERQNRYTSLQAQDILTTQGRLPERRIRREIFWRPIKSFWKTYVKKQGWREGMHGLVFAFLFAWVDGLKWAKYWELVRQQPHETS